MYHDEGYSLSDALIPLGLIIVLSASSVIAAEHPLASLMPPSSSPANSPTIDSQTINR